MFHPVSLSANQSFVLFLVGASLLAVTLISVTGIVFGVLQAMAKTRAEVGLKHEMLQRGMSPEEIVRVVLAEHGVPLTPAGAVNLPCASEAVVEWNGDWCPALVLQADAGRYYVHYVGHDMDSNEWVGEDRVRFPAGSQIHEQAARYSPARNGVYEKGPMEAEL